MRLSALQHKSSMFSIGNYKGHVFRSITEILKVLSNWNTKSPNLSAKYQENFDLERTSTISNIYARSRAKPSFKLGEEIEDIGPRNGNLRPSNL